MNKLCVKSLNECFNIDGSNWIVDTTDSYTPFTRHKTPSPNKGKKHSESHCENISKSMRGNQKSIDNHKKHYKITFIDGREVYIWGMVEWCKNNQYSFQSLYRFLSGERKKYRDIMTVHQVAQEVL